MRNSILRLVCLVPCLGLTACGSDDQDSPFFARPDSGPDASDSGVAEASADSSSETGSEGGSLDLCGNGLDDDGNGEIDEGCSCTEATTQPCFSGAPEHAGKGICAMGSQTCEKTTSGEFQKTRWGACVGSGSPGAEACNGTDDDCDGTVDDGCPCVDGEEKDCSTVCGAGKQVCSSSGWGECSAAQPQSEICNGADDDCDGTIDDAAPCPSGEKCASGSCVPDCTPVNGGWTDWTCGTCDHCVSPFKVCTRSCTNPAPSCGGAACSGESQSQEDCSSATPQPLSFAAGTQTFSACHDVRAGVVPAGVSQLQFSLWGGGGGGGAPGAGGGGAYVKGTLPVGAGDQIEIRVACGGASENGGGGATFVYRNGTLVMVAAGGGGGGSDGSSGGSTSWNPNAGRGGGGGAVGSVGEAGMENNNYNCGSGGGQGATQTSGGAAGVQNDQSVYTGCSINGVAGASDRGGENTKANCQAGSAAINAWGGCAGCGNGCAGGGGAGYFGGGSGAGKYTYTAGGGGGGSSWISAQVTGSSSEPGVGSQPGGTSAAGYNGIAARGGAGQTSSSGPEPGVGGNGLIVLTIP